ncbi:MAG: hypothetical protein P4L22_05530 [Candidatus Babeliales bacterium]|nr:hypothetical protein [Candidatus Babeliales bacterium]
MFYLLFCDQNQIQSCKTNFPILESIYLIIKNEEFVNQIKSIVENIPPRIFINKEFRFQHLLVEVYSRYSMKIVDQQNRIVLNPNELFNLFDQWNKEQFVFVKTLGLYFDGYKFALKKFDNINECIKEEEKLDKKDCYTSVRKKFEPNYGIVFSNSNNNKMYLIDHLIQEALVLDMYYQDKFSVWQTGSEISLQHVSINILNKDEALISDSDGYEDSGILLKRDTIVYLIDKYKEIAKLCSILDLKKIIITYQDGNVTVDYEII